MTTRLKDGDQLCQPPIVRVARRTITVGIDPLRVLRQEIAMQLSLQISISPNLTPVSSQLPCPSRCHPCVHSATLGFGGARYHSALGRFIGAS